MKLTRVVPIAVASVATALVATSAWAVPPSKSASLADQSVESAQPAVTDDHGVRLGSIGSGMFRTPQDNPHEFWMITDRGPNGQPTNPTRRTFLVPDFDPTILKVRVQGQAVQVLEQIPLKTSTGSPVTGLPNLAAADVGINPTPPTPDEVPFNFDGSKALTDPTLLASNAYNKNGLDTEDIVRTADGTFYVVDEYRPSVVKIGADGTVLARYVPDGLQTEFTGVPNTFFTLPAEHAYRRQNRGYEGLALAPDGSALFVGLQSPLELPGTGGTTTGRASRNTRILKLDLNGNVLGEFVYRFDVNTAFDPTSTSPGDMKISGLYAISATQVLVLERTDFVAKVYLVDLAQTETPTDLGTLTPPSAAELNFIEQLNADGTLEAAGITPLAKTLIVNLDDVDGIPDKIESVSVVNPSQLAVANDNDFGLVGTPTFDAGGKLSNDTLVKSQILYVELPVPLNLGPVKKGKA